MLDAPEPVLWGGELLLRDGAPAGQVTSAAYGHTVGGAVGLGYVSRDDGGAIDTEWLTSAKYQVDIAGALVAATAHIRAPYDPGSERIRL